MPHVFISHAAVDAGLARLIADALLASTPTRESFLSSRPGDIRADVTWLPAIKSALARADAYLIFLTPNSIGRPWVFFESGAAWFANRTLVLARTSELVAEEVPLPIGAHQIYRVDQPEELDVIFHTLGCSPQSSSDLAAAVRNLPVRSAGAGEQAWEGILFDGQYFAWAGPLLNLEDRAEIPVLPGLVEELASRGHAVRFGNRDRLERHLTRGQAQLFATDRRTWRRPVVRQGQLLLVSPSGSAETGESAE